MLEEKFVPDYYVDCRPEGPTCVSPGCTPEWIGIIIAASPNGAKQWLSRDDGSAPLGLGRSLLGRQPRAALAAAPLRLPRAELGRSFAAGLQWGHVKSVGAGFAKR
jgi:hypothetical protein